MEGERIYVTPRALLQGRIARDAVSSGMAWRLAAAPGDLACCAVEVTHVHRTSVKSELVSRRDLEQGTGTWSAFARKQIGACLAKFERPEGSFAGLGLTQTVIMGIVNVTPDSFSDGGRHLDTRKAIDHGMALAGDGAGIIDVGGESTRPGASPVSPDEEIARVVPVVKELSRDGVCVSIDTRHSAVMSAAIEAGARIVNDVTALTGDQQSLHVVAEAGVPVILMHMQGEPQTMQANPQYDWAPGDVFDYLSKRIEQCIAAGIKRENIAVDPGIGFGKTVAHNAEIMDHLAVFHGLGCPIVFGASRKSFIAKMSKGEGVDDRLPGSLAAALHATGQGVQILRVHDVVETLQSLAILKAACSQ